MSNKAVTCSTSLPLTSGELFIFFPAPLYVHINKLYGLLKVLISCSFVQRKRRLPLRGRCTNPLEKTSRGLREEKEGGPRRSARLRTPLLPHPTATLPHSPQWAQQHKPSLTSQEVRFFCTSTFCAAMPEQMVANCCLHWRRTCSSGHDRKLRGIKSSQAGSEITKETERLNAAVWRSGELRD